MSTETCPRPAALLLSLPSYNATATYTLNWDLAPKTCAAICASLPMTSVCFHGRNSGDEALTITPQPILNIPQDSSENCTTSHSMNHLYFGLEIAGKSYGGCSPGHSASEICWFYGPAGLAQYWVSSKGPPHTEPPFVRETAVLNEFAVLKVENGFYNASRCTQRGGETSIIITAIFD
ncbi:hypothetical protein TrLO_g11881 [Triparma laevis f. longispina]|uniref:Uncharacterized protein n=1 Tax=Triparma laevis f. longispina TaxID=1714387 RepID=A0A9W7FTG5_9STRA|nr:hypothetical protein TrLO_g11881 [Triparma laevis f. longispina]